MGFWGTYNICCKSGYLRLPASYRQVLYNMVKSEQAPVTFCLQLEENSSITVYPSVFSHLGGSYHVEYAANGLLDFRTHPAIREKLPLKQWFVATGYGDYFTLRPFCENFFTGKYVIRYDQKHRFTLPREYIHAMGGKSGLQCYVDIFWYNGVRIFPTKNKDKAEGERAIKVRYGVGQSDGNRLCTDAKGRVRLDKLWLGDILWRQEDLWRGDYLLLQGKGDHLKARKLKQQPEYFAPGEKESIVRQGYCVPAKSTSPSSIHWIKEVREKIHSGVLGNDE